MITKPLNIINGDSAAESKKVINKKKIINHLFYEDEKSISDLSNVLFISIPTITSYIEELVSEGWVRGREISTGKQGRNPTLYAIHPDKFHTLLIDLTTRTTKLVIMNLKNQIVEEELFDFGLRDSDQFNQEFTGLIDQGFKKFKGVGKEIIAVGIAAPGLIDHQTNENKTYPFLDHQGKSLTQFISSRWKVPAFILNDSKASGLGESIYGMGKKIDHLLSINVDWGVGLAVVINGHLLNGTYGYAGELGHVQVNPNGELCDCGKTGCLDTIASASALLSKIRRELKDGVKSSLSVYADTPEKIKLETVIEAAQNGDGYSIDTLYNIGMELGKGLSIAVHLFNPQFIVINGVLSKAGNLIVNPIEFAINKYCLPDFKENLVIKVTEIEKTAKLWGMNAHIINQLFKSI